MFDEIKTTLEHHAKVESCALFNSKAMATIKEANILSSLHLQDMALI